MGLNLSNDIYKEKGNVQKGNRQLGVHGVVDGRAAMNVGLTCQRRTGCTVAAYACVDATWPVRGQIRILAGRRPCWSLTQTRRQTMPIDPVCHMSVKPENAAAKVEYVGRVYYFCSRECHQHFTSNLQQYAPVRGEGQREHGGGAGRERG
jgi:YHS domain-containing protein